MFASFIRFRFASAMACALACSLFPASAFAQQPLSLAEAQRLAWARSRLITAQDSAAVALRESAGAAGQLPDPVLKAGVDNLPLSGPDRFSLTSDFMTMRRIGVMQEITGSDKRALKVERVQRDAERADAERRQVIAEIGRDAGLAWTDRYYAQAGVDLIAQQLAQAKLQVQAADIAYRSGRGAQADWFAARVAVSGLEDKLRQAERQAGSAQQMLARWIGASDAARPLAAPPPPAITTASAPGLDHLRSHPELGAMRAQVDAAETELKQAKANTRADWTVEATYQQRGPGYPNMVSVGVSIPLQIDRANRQDREVAAKTAALAQAQAKLEDALIAHEAQVATMQADWTAGRRRVAALQADLLPAAAARAESALTTYKTGKGDLASVVAARRDELDARMQVLTLEQETARLGVQLNYLTEGAATAQ
jgi:outer membrane protein TolC